MQSKAALLKRQIDWAVATGREPDSNGYLVDVDRNLYRPLSDSAQRAFVLGSGSETRPTRGRRAKMAALHSSSALAVNVFDYWTAQPLNLLARALGLSKLPTCFEFEAQFPTGLEGTPPNLDLAFHSADGSVVGVESKFSEWLTPKSPRREQFKPKYFPERRFLWEEVGLGRAQSLASAMGQGNRHFRHLDAAQLLKHMLGLATSHKGNSALVYLFYEWPGRESALHQDEIAAFAEAIGSDMPFHTLTYQGLFAQMRSSLGAAHAAYAEYLEQRYF
jgi:hypothetical protein